jgi:hypothetical protein
MRLRHGQCLVLPKQLALGHGSGMNDFVPTYRANVDAMLAPDVSYRTRF